MKVNVIAFLDGTVIHAPADDGIEKYFKAFREISNPADLERWEKVGATSGVVQIVMDELDYERIPTSNSPLLLAIMRGEE